MAANDRGTIAAPDEARAVFWKEMAAADELALRRTPFDDAGKWRRFLAGLDASGVPA